GANKNSVQIIGTNTALHAQGHFVLDSRKSGAVTTSHLRFGPEPIRSTYLIDEADFVAVHQFRLLSIMPTIDLTRPGGTVLLNAPYPADQVWQHLPAEVQQLVLDRDLKLYAVDAHRLAREVGLGGRINTIMQTCFFQLSGVLPADEAIAHIKAAITRAYGKRGQSVIERNLAAVDRALAELAPVKTPAGVTGALHRMPPLPAQAPDFVHRVTASILAGAGDRLPVSALPVDGTWPTGTAGWEKRAIAQELPVWDPSICTDCGKCALVCPHTAIRIKVFEPSALDGAPEGFAAKPFTSREQPGRMLTVQVAPDDCTGCGICVDVCPARSKTEQKHKSLDLAPAPEHRDAQRPNYEFFLGIPEVPRDSVRHDTVKGVAQLQPLFEFSGACSGCGETPYIKTLTQLFGDRMVIANATGCSSIFGGNLPTTPYTTNAAGRGPAWSNSLFEDNAEFGLGMRLAWERQHADARRYVSQLRGLIGEPLADALLGAEQHDEAGISAQRERVAELGRVLAGLQPPGELAGAVAQLQSLQDELVEKSFWLIGGDGWAYDIGYGGLDHVLSTGRNINILVLDTEVYSNTGGQASKSTPRGAGAKFAVAGKGQPKKDLGAIAMAHGDVYVAQIAMGANEQQTVRALQEAQAWPGPSLVIAYSTCIAHGIEMSTSMSHQKDAVASGYWPLYRYRPSESGDGHPFTLDSRAPKVPVRDFLLSETRFAMVQRANPERGEHLLALAQADATERRRYYEQLSGLTRTLPHENGTATDPDEPKETSR
ncbi:MAG TPA: pyruvate:ferredoxin (flavodoxin) oxidoreductase, partial [Actinoplanes sp.]|nr:pyruvate:ferredoxin (flavodoxin) oxidoreductase [Actinoplanes sp.]